MDTKGYAPIHVHTECSLFDGTTKVSELFPRLKELGIRSVAITEHGNLVNSIKKYKEAKKHGIKLIFGIETYVVKDHIVKDKEEKRYHLVLLAKNFNGYKNLVRLSSIAATDGFYYRARIDKEILRKYSDGLIATSACVQNDVARAVLAGNIEHAEQLVEEYIDIFGKENYFLEVANHNLDEEKVIADAYFKIAKKFDIKVIFGIDAHMLNKEHKSAHEDFICIMTRSSRADPKRFQFHGENFHMMSNEEVRKLFPDNPEIFDNTLSLASLCNVDLELGKHVFPDFKPPNNMTNEEYFDYLINKGFEDKYPSEPLRSQAKEKIKYEKGIIKKMGYVDYFLIIADIIQEMNKRQGISTAGRGSAAGSVVAYCLDIHQIEPITNGLIFERFLNPDRVSLPDIDTDFADRDGAIEYVQEKYGSDKVGLIGTFGTLMSKAAIKDVSRVHGISFQDMNNITKNMTAKTIQEELTINPEFAEFAKKNPKIIESAKILEGCIKFSGVHAAGVIWGKEAISEYVPVRKVDNQIVSQYDMHEVEDVGLVKFDFLGLETMNVIRNTLKMIGKDDQWLRKIPLNDKPTYDMMSRGETVGCFQIESGGMINTIKSVRPTNFNDIAVVIALYRPGSLDYVDLYGRRKNGEEQFEYEHPVMEKCLSDTFNILVFQESLMQLCVELCGFTPARADTMRKIVGKKLKDKMLAMEKEFKEGAISHSKVSQEFVYQLWQKVVKFADYSFNRAHAASYALSSYRTAYLKCHYPVEFMAAVINSKIGDVDDTVFYINEARRMGIKILPPDVNKSEKLFTCHDGNILFGLEGIKNVSGVSLENIMDKRPYKSFIDFANRVDPSKVNKRVQKHLIEAGCFDQYGVHRHSLLAGYLDIVPKNLSGEKQLTLFGTDASLEYTYPQRKEPTKLEKIRMEKEVIGISASGNLMEMFESYKQYKIPKSLNEGRVQVFGIVTRLKKVLTKRDQREMAFVQIENDDGKYDIVVFPNQYSVYWNDILEDSGILIEGTLKDGSILADTIVKIEPEE